MAARPSGTVTFLFTDIEGSTQLWENHPEWMERAHARQEAILREVFSAHGGYPYKMIGDAFQVAFGSAPTAVAAAVGAQRALQSEPWGGPGEIRVRMALHTGETEERGDDYVGPILNRVARLMSAGHGGQVLLSQTTYDLVRDRLPARIGVRDLGERRLRDLNRPEHVHQLVVPGLRQEFPPLKTLDALPNNLPVQITQFVGREQPLAELTQSLERSRLVTLTGAGGAGKSRLALQLGSEILDRFAHGVWLIELGALVDDREIAPAVAAALGVEEVAGRPTLDTLVESLAGEQRLLVLDNCEHLVRGVAVVVSKLLQASPHTRILATSREPLRIPGELTYRVPSLEIPGPEQSASFAETAASEAVRLFVDRAASVSPTFALSEANVSVVIDICRRLDGIPLAIELAAARATSLSVEKLASRLGDRFRLLTRGSRVGLPRQQTLRALIDWSHELLAEEQRVLLRRLAAFAGSFSLEAAEAVCAGGDVDEGDVLDLLTDLVEKSLVVLEPGGERYRLLETIREYALERLRAAGEETDVRERHLAHYLALAERSSDPIQRGDLAVRRALEPDHENLLAAGAWCDQAPGHAEHGLRLVRALTSYFSARDVLEQGHQMVRRALARPGAEQHTLIRCFGLYDLAWYQLWVGQAGDGEAAAAEGLAIARELGDPTAICRGLRLLGVYVSSRGEAHAARPMFEEAVAVARANPARNILAPSLESLAEFLRQVGDLERAEVHYLEAVGLHRSGGQRVTLSLGLLNLAALNVKRGTGERAVPILIEALGIATELDLKSASQYTLDVCTGLAALRREWDVAARLYGAAEALRLRIGMVRDAMDDAYLEPSLAATREALGDDAYAAAEAAGRGLGYDAALDDARAWLTSIRGHDGEGAT
ncbi:MAG: adenylate/guanylate cyclase domain-containing protein [bacterium]